jgi:hypothetical protein
MTSWKAFVIVGAICLGATHLAGCDQMPPIDENFDSSLGADFRPPDGATPDGATPDGGATNAGDAADAAVRAAP